MIRQYVSNAQDWAEEKLRRLCGRITPARWLAVILTALALFGAASLYILASAIYVIGKGEGERIVIEHIEGLKLDSPTTKQNSINP